MRWITTTQKANERINQPLLTRGRYYRKKMQRVQQQLSVAILCLFLFVSFVHSLTVTGLYCPLRDCKDRACPFTGFVIDKRGCPTCRCRDPREHALRLTGTLMKKIHSQLEQQNYQFRKPNFGNCPKHACMRFCPHGHETDLNGCRKCSCLKGPLSLTETSKTSDVVAKPPIKDSKEQLLQECKKKCTIGRAYVLPNGKCGCVPLNRIRPVSTLSSLLSKWLQGR